MLLRKGGKSTIKGLCDIWLREPNSVSTLISRMQKQGLVTKTKYPRRKEYQIEITEKGRKIQNQITHDSIDGVFSILSEADIHKLSQYLKLLLIRARSMLGYNDNYPASF